MLAFVCGATGIYLEMTEIPHKNAGDGLLAGCLIRAGEKVGSYYGSVLYSHRGGKKQLKKTWEEGVIAVAVQQFSKWAIKIP